MDTAAPSADPSPAPAPPSEPVLFPVGSVVVLKSGGPAMTVILIVDDGWTTCQWFEGKILKLDRFQQKGLKDGPAV